MEKESIYFDNNYFPRKCSSTNKILTSKDHSSIQIKICCVNKDGYYEGKVETYVICGFLRKSGKADYALNRLVKTNPK